MGDDFDLDDELKRIDAELADIRGNLWPDSYAGGATVERLVAEMQALCRVLREANAK